MLYAAVVDDEEKQRMEFTALIEEIFRENGVYARIFEFSRGEDFLSSQTEFQLVFLDVYMDGMTGIETARVLRSRGDSCTIIFLTTSTEHAVDGFRVRAFHYIVKPYTPEEVSQVVEEYLRSVKAERYFEITVGGTDQRIKYSALLWADHYRHQIQLHLKGGQIISVRMTFRDFSEKLAVKGGPFVVCTQGSLVNLDHVEDMDSSGFHMDNGEVVPISRAMRRQTKEAFAEWLTMKLTEM
ncbi:MAG: LytTR family DNA-binding domain-containing protein [Eubacteriales bacterium]|nr:LytTR family DNA-binding domain-containing protein [Eubacteriales bacterium]